MPISCTSLLMKNKIFVIKCNKRKIVAIIFKKSAANKFENKMCMKQNTDKNC